MNGLGAAPPVSVYWLSGVGRRETKRVGHAFICRCGGGYRGRAAAATDPHGDPGHRCQTGDDSYSRADSETASRGSRSRGARGRAALDRRATFSGGLAAAGSRAAFDSRAAFFLTQYECRSGHNASGQARKSHVPQNRHSSSPSRRFDGSA